MKLILQDLANGTTRIVEAPTPTCKHGHLLIDTRRSLISVGTERMLVEFGKASYISKARKQPEKVRAVIDKISTDGLLSTVNAVQSKLAQPISLGYCNVGVVAEVGEGVDNFRVGDRVVSNGGHSDVVLNPKNLCARIPDDVTDEQATFVVLASIGLQGIRLLQPTIGECVVVIGTGVIGLLTVQLLRAHGCRVLAIDFDESKLLIARKFGAEVCNPMKGEDPVAASIKFSRGQGVDGVIITASTKSNEPVTQAARMSRKRGRIVLVGVTGLEINRADFYEKELTFQVSCSYGPGRYDSQYEVAGHDYPIGFVRWTEQRNFEAILDLMSDRSIDVDPLISHRFKFEQSVDAYDLLTSDKGAIGILLEYESNTIERHITRKRLGNITSQSSGIPGDAKIGFVGAGNYASRILIPAFTASGAHLQSISTSGGTNAVVHGERAGFSEATTDTSEMIRSTSINTVVIVTRHNSHAKFVVEALRAGKNVFVEKPLAIGLPELDEVSKIYNSLIADDKASLLMVGFNRRFSPHVIKMKELLVSVSAQKSIVITVNAGEIPEDHWTRDEKVGGGRIIGEACHFIDLMRFLVGSDIVSVQARQMEGEHQNSKSTENASITLGFADGSFGTILYITNGAQSYQKERIEVFSSGRVLQLNNFRKLIGFGYPGFRKMNLWKQDKGQNACAAAFVEAIRTGSSSPIPAEELFEVARVSIEAAELLRNQ